MGELEDCSSYNRDWDVLLRRLEIEGPTERLVDEVGLGCTWTQEACQDMGLPFPNYNETCNAPQQCSSYSVVDFW